ncbi:MAG TPA: hypothetical protein PKJ99_03505 [Thermoanaerobaculales bacterium]|nr:hypothetical protein [Thermoanaerobaculales bacterium]HPA79971.1 hypothetical protein [Thermoanaerobaculales bacterium]HQN96682.1 hypothetical protein [Thermoanaerobaculales bacterium]HQP43378.1 hypothetical protein [Thermoanaerobaculales bacterium]
MTSSRLPLVVLVGIAAVAGAWLARYLSAEQVIRRQITSAVEAFENEQLLGVATVLSRSYQDQWGMSYESILGHLQEAMDTFSELQVDLEPPAVEVDGDEARVSLRLVVWGTADGERGYVVGSAGSPVTTTGLWRKEAPGWRLVATETLDIPELREELDSMRSR